MPFIKTGLDGVVVFEPRIHKDSRGYFFESYNEKVFQNEGINAVFVQDNQSKSGYGVLRGLHYQLFPYTQAKLVRVLSGSVYDVTVDIRRGSPDFGKWYGAELSAENKRQLYIPRGFAHGFVVLSDTAEFFYKCDNFYNKEMERGILFNDKRLAIKWQISRDKMIVSDKDKKLPAFADADINFTFENMK